MKLIPEGLYKHLFSSYPTMIPGFSHEFGLQNNKKEVLEDKQIPDDLKQILYQDAARQIFDKQQHEAKKPILVKNVEQMPKEVKVEEKPIEKKTEEIPKQEIIQDDQKQYIIDMVNSKRTENILKTMEKSGITINKSNNVVIDGKIIKKSNAVDILRCLTNAHINSNDVIGLNNVIEKMKSIDASTAPFSPGVKRTHFSSPKQRKSNRVKNWTKI